MCNVQNNPDSMLWIIMEPLAASLPADFWTTGQWKLNLQALIWLAVTGQSNVHVKNNPSKNSPRASESWLLPNTAVSTARPQLIFIEGISSGDCNLPLNNKLNSLGGKITHNPGVNNAAAGPSCPCSSSCWKISHISLDSPSPGANLHQGKVLSMQITRNYL